MRRRQDADPDPQDPAVDSPPQDFSIDYELLAEDGILIVRLAGRVTLERLKMVGPMVRAHPGFDHRTGLIHDLSLVDPRSIGGDDLSSLVAVMRRRNAPHGHRVAYVLPSAPGSWGSDSGASPTVFSTAGAIWPGASTRWWMLATR
ncbi:MAG: hypothetical protein U5R48_08985 [Gammaproteobacteria bacterium]|nr:hypothetical protein [Gammaproteobacteria bacterium]